MKEVEEYLGLVFFIDLFFQEILFFKVFFDYCNGDYKSVFWQFDVCL